MTREEIVAKWYGMIRQQRDAWVADVVTMMPRTKRMIPCPDGIDGCAVAHYAYYPRYTTDISAAWAVFDNVGHSRVTMRHPDVWYCEIFSTKTFIECETAPEAICLAAIIAKLTKEDAE